MFTVNKSCGRLLKHTQYDRQEQQNNLLHFTVYPHYRLIFRKTWGTSLTLLTTDQPGIYKKIVDSVLIYTLSYATCLCYTECKKQTEILLFRIRSLKQAYIPILWLRQVRKKAQSFRLSVYSFTLVLHWCNSTHSLCFLSFVCLPNYQRRLMKMLHIAIDIPSPHTKLWWDIHFISTPNISNF